MKLRLDLLVLCGLATCAGPASAAGVGDWTPNGVRVPGTENRQARMVSDGTGGAFVISGPEIAPLVTPTQTLVRLHHILASGAPDASYPDSGRTIWTNAQEVQAVLGWTDRAGGLYVLISACGPPVVQSHCSESGVIRLLHLNASGNLASGWPADGLDFPNAFSPESNIDNVDVQVSDDSHVTVAWSQYVGPGNVVVIQKYTPSAAPEWTPDVPYAGRNGFVSSQSYLRPRLVPDGSGGWIVAAMRMVGDVPTQTSDVVVNRLRGTDGARLWGSAGSLAMQTAGNAALAAAVSDGAGGAVLGGGADGAMRMQRVNASGARQWGTGGLAAGTSASNVLMLAARSPVPENGATLAYAAWLDTAGNRRLQRLVPAGIAWSQWLDGRPIGEAAGDWAMARPVARPAGGAWLFWGAGLADGDVRALPVDSAGVAAGGATDAGLVLCDAPGAPVVTDAFVEGEAITALWSDVRSTPGATYLQRYTVPVLGVPGPAAQTFAFDGVRPNPSRGAWSLSLRLSSAADVRVEVLDLAGRRVADRVLARLAAGEQTVTLEGLRVLAPGVYRVRCTMDGESLTRTAVRLR